MKIIQYTQRDLERARIGRFGKIDDFSHSKQANKLLTLENKIRRLEERLESFVLSSITPILEVKKAKNKPEERTKA
eukprot:768056-Hanusia_phi.AAC.2